MKSPLTFVYQYWLPLSLITLILVTVLSLIPLPELQKFPGTDKTHHFIAYGAVMFPIALRRPQGWVYIALLVLGWSGLIELIQPMVNRFAEWLDLLANFGGLVIGALLACAARLLLCSKNYL